MENNYPTFLGIFIN